MATAAATGRIDYSQTGKDDRFRYKEQYILGALERELLSKELELKTVRNSSKLVAAAVAKDNSVLADTEELLDTLIRDFVNVLVPYRLDKLVNARKNAFDELKTRWEAVYGKIDDPETQKNIAEAERKLNMKMQEAKDTAIKEALESQARAKMEQTLREKRMTRHGKRHK